MNELLEVVENALREKGYKHDPDLCLWYTEGRSLKDGSVVKISIPPFGITHKQLYERLSELKEKKERAEQ